MKGVVTFHVLNPSQLQYIDIITKTVYYDCDKLPLIYSGYAAQSDVTATQPVGYAAAYAAAKQRIAHVRSVHGDLNNNIPVIAVEGFLHESVTDR